MSGRHYCLAKALVEQGHEVHYYTWALPYNTGVKALIKHLFTSLLKKEYTHEEFHVHTARRLPYFWPVINGIIFKKQLRNLFKQIDADIIITESYTNETEVPKDLPFIYDLADDYAGPADVYGSPLYKFAFRLLDIRGVMKRQSQNAVAVTAVSDMLVNYAKPLNENVVKLPNGVEDAIVKKILRAKQEKKSQHSIVYATNFGPWSRAIETLETVTALREEFPDIDITLIGSGSESDNIQQYIIDHDAEHYIHYLGYIYDRERLFQLLSQSSIGLNISDKNKWRDASHPMKVMDYSALGIKVVSTNLREVEALGYENIYLFSDEANKNSFSDALRKALNDRKTYPKVSKEVLSKYSWDKLVKKLTTVSNPFINRNAKPVRHVVRAAAVSSSKTNVLEKIIKKPVAQGKLTREEKTNQVDTKIDAHRIVHVSYAYPPAVGGLEQVVEQLATSQAEAGMDVSVITSDKGFTEDAKHVDTVPTTRLKSFVIANTTIIPRLLGHLLNLQKNDIVHLHIAQAFTPEIVWLASKLRGFNYVAHVHLDVPPSGRAGFLLRIYKPLILGKVLRDARGVAVFTDEQRQQLSKQYRVDATRVHVIPNGVATEFFIEKRRTLRKKPRLLFVGRLSYQKNLTQLLDALYGVSDKFTTTIVGDGELGDELKAYAEKLKLKNITFAGVANGSKLRSYYEQADIFVLPSEREGMPLVLLEAMASGLPIVATRVTGNKDVVKHRKNGLLVPYGNAVALRTALTKLAADKSQYRSMSQTAKTMAHTFTWAAVRDRFAAIYPRQKTESREVARPIQKNSVALPAVILPLLVLAVAAFLLPNILGSVITLLFFLTVPGNLLLRKLADSFGGWWERAGLSVVLSLLVIMVGGLMLNSLNYLGLERPLTTVNTFIMLSLATLLLIWLNRKERVAIQIPKLSYPSVLYLIVATLLTLLPVMAIGGAIRLNNGASNILTMVMFGVIAILFLVLLLKKELKPLIPYALFMFALSILLSTSLRGWYITGHDIRNEFQVFRNTDMRDLWLVVVPSRDPYNSCLSISILPALLHNIANIPPEFIYKVVYQVMFAIGIVPMLYMFRKFLKDRAAFLATFIVITFPAFMNDMTFLNRQEIAYLFFVALLGVTFSRITSRSKYALTIALLLGILLSHYSTNYVTIGLLVAAFIIYKILTFKKSVKKDITIPILTIPIILFAIVTTYLWGSIITQTSPNIENTISRAVKAISNGDTIRSSTTGFSIFGIQQQSRQEILADYAKEDKDSISYIEEDILPLTPYGKTVNGMIDVEGVNRFIHSSIAKLYQVLVVLGTGVLIARHIIKRRKNELTVKDSYLLAITSGAVVILVMLTILPYVSVSYDVGRLFMQTLFITAIPIVVAGEFIFQKTRHAILVTSIVFVFIFLFISGFLPQLTGGYNPKISLANSGTYYNFFYEHGTDRASSHWLLENRDVTKKVFLDTDASSKLPLYVSSGLLHQDTSSGYVFMSYRNATANAFRIFPNGELIEYSDERETAGRNLLYANRGSEVYGPKIVK